WRLLPDYRFDPLSGLWRHRAGAPEPPLSLRDINYSEATPHSAHRHREPESALSGYLTQAREILNSSKGHAETMELSPDFEHLRWFWLPQEIAASSTR
ncbi:MAG TPA: aminotransferase, partial [Candidatus Dormibacteraeota bacterium]